MKPIKTKREKAAAERGIHELREQLAFLKETYRQDRDAYKLATSGLRQLLRETQHAVAVYEQAQVGRLPRVIGSRNARTGELELPRLLRLLRQAAQLSQAALARHLGTRQGDISRWEQEGYEGYSLRQLKRIADVLGYDLEVSFLRRKARS